MSLKEERALPPRGGDESSLPVLRSRKDFLLHLREERERERERNLTENADVLKKKKEYAF